MQKTRQTMKYKCLLLKQNNIGMKHECMAIKQECVLGVTIHNHGARSRVQNVFVDPHRQSKEFFCAWTDKKPLHKFKLNSNKAYSMVYYTQDKAIRLHWQGDCNATDLM